MSWVWARPKLYFCFNAISLCYSFRQDGSNDGNDDNDNDNANISRREKARLRDMQKLKKQKIQDMLDEQNAAIDADMVCLINGYTSKFPLFLFFWDK